MTISNACYLKVGAKVYFKNNPNPFRLVSKEVKTDYRHPQCHLQLVPIHGKFDKEWRYDIETNRWMHTESGNRKGTILHVLLGGLKDITTLAPRPVKGKRTGQPNKRDDLDLLYPGQDTPHEEAVKTARRKVIANARREAREQREG